jgi:uncharacterized OB-fold protein
MTNVPDQAELPTLTPFIRTLTKGEHYLAGSHCKACHAIFVGERAVCAACCARGQMETVRLADTGRIYAYTIVERSYPGVKTPFVDVTVDLDDGAHIKGTLEGVDPIMAAVRFDMPVKLAFREAQPINTPGQPYLTYVFVPA